MPRPIHFEIHASEPERAVAFYTTVFDWRFERWGEQPYWVITTGAGPGIDGGLVQRQGPDPEETAPVHGFVNTVDVPDLDAALDAVSQAGGTLALPKSAVPGVGWLAYCKDTEGNVFGMLQPEENA